MDDDINKWGLDYKTDGADGHLYCRIREEEVRPVELIALLLKQAQKIVKDETKLDANEGVLTVPAYFTEAQRRETRDAARIAGFEVRRIINEPTAIAVAYLWDSDREGRFLVIDAGGGTTDCSRVKVRNADGVVSFLVEATSGDNALGGEDFLDRLVNLFQLRANKAGLNIPRRTLRALCEVEKRKNDGPNSIVVAGDTTLTIPRAKYGRAVKGLLKRMEDIIIEAQGDEQLDGIILGGGAMCQLEIRNHVENMFKGSTILPSLPPGEVVAMGAAVLAHDIASGENRFAVTEVSSRDLGINTQVKNKKVDRMEVILRKNAPLPASHIKKFIAIDAEETEISVYEGGEEKSSKNILLGTLYIPALESEELSVKITALASGEVDIKVFGANGAKKELKVDRNRMALGDDEIEVLKKAAHERFSPIVVQQTPQVQRGRKRKRGGKQK